MGLIVFSSAEQFNREYLETVLKHVCSETVPVEIYFSIEELGLRLCRPDSQCPILLLFPETRLCLQKLVDMQEYFESMRTVVILPDSEPATIAVGHLLRPRFMTVAHRSTAPDIARVVERLVHKASPQPAGFCSTMRYAEPRKGDEVSGRTLQKDRSTAE